MRSFIILEVEHGEDTDDFQEYAEYISWPNGEYKIQVRDYSVRVDLDPYLTAVSVNAIIDRGTGKVL